MAIYKVAEIFESINGEGLKAGKLAVFVRFCGCNCRCSYCDTAWANERHAPHRQMDLNDLLLSVRAYPEKELTVTGGEPLLQEGIDDFLAALVANGYAVEAETNGSVPLAGFIARFPQVSFTMDYKLPGSGMEKAMCTKNFDCLRKSDCVKFVISDENDFYRAHEIAREYSLNGRVPILLSPVHGKLNPETIVELMKKSQWTFARLQLQLHKIVWGEKTRGV